MAGINVTVRRFNAIGLGTFTTGTLNDIRDGETAGSDAAMILRPVGLLAGGESTPGDPGILHQYIIRPAASDIGGYLKLEESINYKANSDQVVASTNAGPYPELTNFEEFSTDAGLMDGIDGNGSTTAFRIQAKKASSTEDIFMRIKAYHRTTGGTETLLDEVDVGPLDTTLTEYTGDLTTTASWGTNERLVLKYVIVNNGIPI